MFIDASALCAVLLDEPDGMDYALRIRRATAPKTSPIALFEATLAVARVTDGNVVGARRNLDALMAAAGIEVVAIGEPELARALDAFDRFGKGRHPARLNMGDCFAYACAKALGEPLLCKGDDFVQTDVLLA